MLKLTLLLYSIIQYLEKENGAMATVVWTPDPAGYTNKGLQNSLAQKCLAVMPQFLSSTNFLFQIFNTINRSGTIPFSKTLMFYRIFTSSH